jgi:DNA-binding CsgD family transcriptional regulator
VALEAVTSAWTTGSTQFPLRRHFATWIELREHWVNQHVGGSTVGSRTTGRSPGGRPGSGARFGGPDVPPEDGGGDVPRGGVRGTPLAFAAFSDACSRETMRLVVALAARSSLDAAAYFGGSTARDGRVPPRLVDWINTRAATVEDGDGVPRAREPLVIAGDGGHLEIHVVDHGQSLLVREHRATPSPKALRALGLSPRETQVLAWVVEGKTNGEVGAILGARPRTVAKHLERIFRKLGVETRTAAAASVLSRP